MRDFTQLPSFNGVAASQTATLEIPVGGTYYGIQLTYGTSTAGGANQTNMQAELTEFRLKVNGNVQRTFSFAQLAAINAIRGHAFATGIVDIVFAPPSARTAQGEDFLAWGTADVQTFQLEVDIGAATAPTLEARAVWSPEQRTMGQIVKWKRFTIPVTGAGTFTQTQFPRGDGYYAVHGFSANTTTVEVKTDQRQRFKATLAQATAMYALQGVTMQASIFSVLFNATNRVADALATRNPDGSLISELRFDYTQSGAGSFTALTETLGLRD